jgi:hypothetical protein
LVKTELSLSKKGNQKTEKSKKEVPSGGSEPTKPWIQMRTGAIVIAITSVFLAALTAWQAYPRVGAMEAILWGLFYGGLIWVIFIGNVLIGRFLRRKR